MKWEESKSTPPISGTYGRTYISVSFWNTAQWDYAFETGFHIVLSLPGLAHLTSNTGAHRRDYFWMKLNRRQAPEAQPRQPLPGIQDLGPDELVWNKPPDTYPAQMLGSLALIILLGTCYLLTLPPEPEIYPSKEVFYLSYMPTIF